MWSLNKPIVCASEEAQVRKPEEFHEQGEALSPLHWCCCVFEGSNCNAGEPGEVQFGV